MCMKFFKTAVKTVVECSKNYSLTGMHLNAKIFCLFMH